MKYILKYSSCVFLLLISLPVSAKVVHSVDQIPSQIHNKDGNANNSVKEMNGDALPDAFGSRFWSSQTSLKPNDIIKIIDPQGKDEKWSLVGMKAWPGQKDLYIIVACSIKQTQKELDADQKNSCSDEEGAVNKIIIAVVDYDGSGIPKLAAQPYIENISGDKDDEADVANGKILKKSAFDLIDDSGYNTIGDLKNLDFAHYQVNPQTLAFGIRFEARNMYPRGDVTNQSTTLFAIINHKLLPILTSKIYFSKYMAPPLDGNGRWVGSEIDESKKYVLSILSHQTNGFNDIKRTQKGSHNNKGKIYRWNSQKLQYQ